MCSIHLVSVCSILICGCNCLVLCSVAFTGFGRMQLIIFFGCAIQQFYVTNEQFGISLITVAARCELNIGDHHLSWLMTAGLIAQVCTSHYMGFKSDEIGRRKLLVITSTLTIVTSFISSLMPEFWSFLVMRFIVGCL